MLICFDPNLRFQLWDDTEKLRRRVNDFIPLCDILKISDEELEFITGEKDIKKAAPMLIDRGVKLVVYTCGKDGAHAFTRNAASYSPSEKVRSVDTTGAWTALSVLSSGSCKASGSTAIQSAPPMKLRSGTALIFQTDSAH